MQNATPSSITPEGVPEINSPTPTNEGDMQTMISEMISSAIAPVLERLDGLRQPESSPPAAEVSPSEEVVKQAVESEMSALGDEDRAIVEQIAGDDKILAFKVLSVLKLKGKLGVQPTVKVGGRPSTTTYSTAPRNMKEAKAALAHALAGKADL